MYCCGFHKKNEGFNSGYEKGVVIKRKYDHTGLVSLNVSKEWEEDVLLVQSCCHNKIPQTG
jgi:hypothetical protein